MAEQTKSRPVNGHSPPTTNPAVQMAAEAGLRYVADSQPGLTRKRVGKSFRYLDADGKLIRDRKILDRIQSLVIPPAWNDVWICPLAHGHIQATGRDARNRKQYIYHPDWRIIRDETKYDQMLAFAAMLPKIRRRIRRDLKSRQLTREKVLATVVRLLEISLIRVGNEEYAKTNRSFGLTTMRHRHVEVSRSKIRFEFRGKSGIQHEIDIEDPMLAKIVRQCHELPGQNLFQYLDENGERREITSNDVNEYLHEITGMNFTAKDFRTWGGTALAARALQEIEPFESDTAAKRNITQAIRNVAQRLGNTVTICRKCYVHPAIITAYLDQSLATHFRVDVSTKPRRAIACMSVDEASVLQLLKAQQRQRLREAKQVKKRLAKS